MKYKAVVLSALLLLLANGVVAQPSFVLPLETYVENQMSSNNIPGMAIGIIQKGKVVYCKGFGVANSKGEALTSDSPFVLASLTKSFTGLAITHLVEEGKLKYEDKVKKHLPFFELKNTDYDDEITIDHLLQHTSGIPRISSYKTNKRELTLEAKVKRLASIEGNGRFNQFQYANDNYAILGLIIEKLSKLSYEEYVQHNILDPLALKDTFFSQNNLINQNPALGHIQYFGMSTVSRIAYYSANLPNGGMLSSVKDISSYLCHYLKNAQTEQPYDVFGNRELKYRKGWFISPHEKGTQLSHGGSLADFRHYMTIYPEIQFGLIVLINQNSLFLNKKIGQIPNDLLRIIDGQEPRKSKFSLSPAYWVFIIISGFLIILFFIILIKQFQSNKIYSLSKTEISKLNKSTWISNILIPVILFCWMWYIGNYLLISLHKTQPDILLMIQSFFIFSFLYGVIVLFKIKKAKQKQSLNNQ